MRNVRRLLLTGLATLLLCGLLIGCTTPARQDANPTAAPIAQADTPIPEATHQPAETPTRATPSSAGGGGLAPSLQLEPTATATAAPPTPAPTATPLPTSSVVPGWLTYENRFLGYSFSYPPEATIDHHGTNVEPPEDIMSYLEYMAWEKTVYPNDLCVGVGYKAGSVTVMPKDETLSLYASPCGITGVGDQIMASWEETVTINDQPYTASAFKLYNRQTNQLESESYLLLHVNDDKLRIDVRVNMMGAPGSAQLDLSEAEINETRETLWRIVESFRFQ